MGQQGNKTKDKKYMETNEIEKNIQNLWDAAKVVVREKSIAIQAYLKKQEKSQIKNLTLYLKDLEKEQQRKPKNSIRKEIMKIRAEINGIEIKQQNKSMKPGAGSLKNSIKLINLQPGFSIKKEKKYSNK